MQSVGSPVSAPRRRPCRRADRGSACRTRRRARHQQVDVPALGHGGQVGGPSGARRARRPSPGRRSPTGPARRTSRPYWPRSRQRVPRPPHGGTVLGTFRIGPGRDTMAGRWRTKSVEQSIADTDEPDTRLRKNLTWWTSPSSGCRGDRGRHLHDHGVHRGQHHRACDLDLVRLRRRRLRPGRAVLRGVRLDGAGGRQRLHVLLRDLRRVVAWIIGWDLVLEFAVGAAVVAKAGRATCHAARIGGGTAIFAAFNFTGAPCSSSLFVTIVLAWAPSCPAGSAWSSRRSRWRWCCWWSSSGFYIKASNFSPFIPPAEAGQGGSRRRNSRCSRC